MAREMLERASVPKPVVASYLRAISLFGSRDGVTGVDLGVKLRDHSADAAAGITIRIHVRQKAARNRLPAAERFPRAFEGIPIDVIQANYGRHHTAAAQTTLRQRSATIQPGMSVSHAQGSSGTVGMFVRGIGADKPSVYVLSADHVLADVGNPNAGDPIIQPGREDLGAHPADTFAGLHRRSLEFDAAVAKCTAAAGRTYSNVVAGTQDTIFDCEYPTYGMILHKVGISTDMTMAEVDGIGLYEGLGPGMHLKPVTTDADTDPICEPGDSGAIWFDPTTMRAVGLHVRGSLVPTPHEQFAIATSIPKLCDALLVTPKL